MPISVAIYITNSVELCGRDRWIIMNGTLQSQHAIMQLELVFTESNFAQESIISSSLTCGRNEYRIDRECSPIPVSCEYP